MTGSEPDPIPRRPSPCRAWCSGLSSSSPLPRLPLFDGFRLRLGPSYVPRYACLRSPSVCPCASFHSIQPLAVRPVTQAAAPLRSEEHTSELQSLMRLSYAVFCLKKKRLKQILILHIMRLITTTTNI